MNDIKLSNAQIAWRAAQDIADGAYVNLGIGFPEMVAQYQPQGRQAIFHTENGILGFGPSPAQGDEDWDLINAGKRAVTLSPGAAYFHHADSFGMVRGGHLDVAILGAYQISQNGDLANWRIGKKGVPKLVEQCAFPLTGLACVTRIYTSLAVIDIVDGRFVLLEKLPDISLSELQSVTDATLHTPNPVTDLIVPAL